MYFWIIVGLIIVALVLQHLLKPKPPSLDDFDKPPPAPTWPEGE